MPLRSEPRCALALPWEVYRGNRRGRVARSGNRMTLPGAFAEGGGGRSSGAERQQRERGGDKAQKANGDFILFLWCLAAGP